MLQRDSSNPGTPTIDYAGVRAPAIDRTVIVFWTIFWAVGAPLAVGAVFATTLIQRADAQLLQASAMIWVAAAVLYFTGHRLRFRLATVWTVALWLHLLYWMVRQFSMSALSFLFFWPVTLFQIAVLAALTWSLVISLRWRLWRDARE